MILKTPTSERYNEYKSYKHDSHRDFKTKIAGYYQRENCYIKVCTNVI